MNALPIRIRLTAWYIGVIFCTLIASCLLMYYGIQNAMEDTVDAQLTVRSENLEHFLQQGDQHSATTPQSLPATAGLAPGDELYQISDSSGDILFQSAAMRDLEVPLNINERQHHYRHHRDRGQFTTYYRRHADLRVLTSMVRFGDYDYRIQVATDVNPLSAVLESFREWARTILPLIVLLASLGGYWLTGRAIKPVHDLALSTRDISERSLSKRIALPSARDELRELAETMNAMLARLESAFARVTRFTADASHELRTPITVIRTTAEVLLERERSREQQEEMVGLILREAESTSTLIEQLLKLARTDADTERLQLEPMDLRDILLDLNKESGTLARVRDLQWRLDVPEQAVPILGDRANVRRMLLILIENSCRYTEPGGSVRLSLSADQRVAVIEVSDSGIGIPQEELGQVFERFYRASNARFYNAEGNGLGLSIAQWIATAHAGTLTAQSTQGTGTCMTVRLPRQL